jgi:hypothetical protein
MNKRILLGLLLMPCVIHAMHKSPLKLGFTKKQLLIEKKESDVETMYVRYLPPKLCCASYLIVKCATTSQEYSSNLTIETPVHCVKCRIYNFGQADQKRDEKLFNELAAEYEKQQKEKK